MYYYYNVLLTPLCIIIFFSFCIDVTHSVFCTTYVLLFIVYVTLPAGIGPIAVGNKYIIYIRLLILNLVVCVLLRVLDQVQGFPSNATLFHTTHYLGDKKLAYFRNKKNKIN
jgi:uncharacterized membrane protein